MRIVRRNSHHHPIVVVVCCALITILMISGSSDAFAPLQTTANHQIAHLPPSFLFRERKVVPHHRAATIMAVSSSTSSSSSLPDEPVKDNVSGEVSSLSEESMMMETTLELLQQQQQQTSTTASNMPVLSLLQSPEQLVSNDDTTTTTNSYSSTQSLSWLLLSEVWQGRWLVLAAAAIYGTNFATVKLLDVSMTVASAAAARFSLAAVAVCLPIYLQEQREQHQLDTAASNHTNTKLSTADGRWTATWLGAEVGAWYCIGYICQALGLETVDASKVRIIHESSRVELILLSCAIKCQAIIPNAHTYLALHIILHYHHRHHHSIH
jgi:hypothetical protein